MARSNRGRDTGKDSILSVVLTVSLHRKDSVPGSNSEEQVYYQDQRGQTDGQSVGQTEGQIDG